MNAKVVSFLNL